MTENNKLDIKGTLNEQQAAAVLAPDGPVLVIAAAGTGKTRTLTHRVAHLIDRGEDPQGILLLTFTNKAALEMLERARKLVGQRVSGIWGGTFHHVANRILRSNAVYLGYKNDFTILDEDDNVRLCRTVLREILTAEKIEEKTFPKPKVLLSIFSLAANTLRPIEDAVDDHFSGHGVDGEIVMRIHDAYMQRKIDNNAMSFDDLLVNALKLCREHPEVAGYYQDRFQHVLVDEYQDTNAIQGAWIDILARKHGNLFVVGDDFQSIYSWRGADYRQFLTFPDRYPGARQFKLEINYRSVPEVLAVANACIAGNPEQFQKTLQARREPYTRPRILKLRDGRHQAQTIIHRIEMLEREGYRRKDIAILYRSHFHALELQLELARNRIPYSITSGIRFFEQAHIKDVSALPRLVHNSADEVSFMRLLEFLPKVGPKTAAKIWDKMQRRFNPLDEVHRAKLMTALPKAAAPIWAPVNSVFEENSREELAANPSLLIECFVEKFYDDYAANAFDNYDRRMEDIAGLEQFAARYQTLNEFLEEVALLTNLDGGPAAHDRDNDKAIRLTTVHQSKGLEWSVVFILWCCDGMFPSTKSMEGLEGDSEERRLFYVATTRAKDELYYCCPSYRVGFDRRVMPVPRSRFISEVDESLFR